MTARVLWRPEEVAESLGTAETGDMSFCTREWEANPGSLQEPHELPVTEPPSQPPSH